jgi:3-oxoacyl-[acyl-carrier-protein] synthase I
MKNVFIIADNIVSPLGNTTTENFSKLVNGISAVKQHSNKQINDETFFASLFDKDDFKTNEHYTKFEHLLIASIKNALQQTGIDFHNKRQH